VYPNGTIISLESEKIKAFHVPTLPREVAKEWMESLMAKDWIRASIQTIIRISSINNLQPHLILDKGGHKWWSSLVEFPEEGKFTLLLVDAESTEPVVYIYKFDQTIIGPSEAKSRVVEAHPDWNWNNLLLQDLLPLSLNDTFAWRVIVTTRDARTLVSIEIVNAGSGSVSSFPVRGKISAQNLLLRLRGVRAWENSIILQETSDKHKGGRRINILNFGKVPTSSPNTSRR
jgi:hypothetical protein